MRARIITVATVALVACEGARDMASDASSDTGVADTAADATSGDDALTYFRDIKPIVDAKCAVCHRPGSVAPFDFTTYEQLYALREAVRNEVSQGTMPPWPPAQGCADYLGDRSLEADQIEIITAWVDGGAPKGNPVDEGAPLDTGPVYELSRIDHVLSMASAYVPGPQPDDYRCFVVDWPVTDTAFVTGLRFVAGEPRLVHHGIVYAAGPEHAQALAALDDADAQPGYECFGGPAVPAGWLGVWVPGAVGGDFPPGTGVRVEPGSRIVLQIHYAANLDALSDLTRVELSTEAEVAGEAWIQPWMDPTWVQPEGLTIPAGEPEVRVSSELDPVFFVGGGEPLTMHTVGLHMHLLGRRGRLDLVRADGSEECLLDIPRWDFAWQGAYALAEPRVLQLGDRLRIACEWDNSPENQPVIDGEVQPPIDTVWGEGTRDEMCLGAFYLTR